MYTQIFACYIGSCFAGMLEGIARIEGEAYTLLTQLGASQLKSVLTAGGGASNDTWTRIRCRQLGVDVSSSLHGVVLSRLSAALIFFTYSSADSCLNPCLNPLCC